MTVWYVEIEEYYGMYSSYEQVCEAVKNWCAATEDCELISINRFDVGYAEMSIRWGHDSESYRYYAFSATLDAPIDTQC